MNTKLNKILAEISAGELIDKITILEIKREKISDRIKLEEVNKKKKFCITHFHSRIFIRWLEIIQDQMLVPHLV